MLAKLADNTDSLSAASRFRKRRVRRFADLLRGTSGEVRILDAGGTPAFWLRHRDEMPANVSLTLLNVDFMAQPVQPWMRIVKGDVRHMKMFDTNEFDMCFSNSLIEHLGTRDQQLLAANEIRRVAKGYFVQTPNIWFPIEPHFLVPGWQFAPIALRTFVLQRFNLGWIKRQRDPLLARAEVESVRLLSAAELTQLFPDGRVERERVGPLTKSVIAWRPML